MSFSSRLRPWKPLFTLRKGIVHSPQPRRTRHGHPPTSRPSLEALEDRSLPSAVHAPLADLAPPDTGVVATAAEQWVVPFQITGGGPAPAGLPLVPGGAGPHSATGTATHLGKYTGEGTFVLGTLSISPTGQVSGTFEGSFVFVAANGDRLTFTYGDGFTGTFTGQLSADGTAVMNVTFDALFTPDPQNSTGRFANVTGGGFRMIAQADSISLVSSVPGYTAPFNYTWSGEGSLVFGKGK